MTVNAMLAARRFINSANWTRSATNVAAMVMRSSCSLFLHLIWRDPGFVSIARRAYSGSVLWEDLTRTQRRDGSLSRLRDVGSDFIRPTGSSLCPLRGELARIPKPVSQPAIHDHLGNDISNYRHHTQTRQ